MSESHKIAVIVSPEIMRKIGPGLSPHVSPEFEFWQVDLYRSPEDIQSILSDWNPSGIITEFHPYVTETLFSFGKPTIFVLSNLLLEGAGSVDFDEFKIGKMAMNHLKSLGLQNFAYYGKKNILSDEVKSGFKQGISKSASIHEFEEKSQSFHHGIEYWKRPNKKFSDWVASLPRPIGVFAAHDPLARNLLETCHELGIRVPEEVSIIAGNNDPLVCEMTYPQISAIELEWPKIGNHAASLIKKWILNHRMPETPEILIEPSAFIKRGSSDLSVHQDLRISQAIQFIQNNYQNGINVNDVLNQIPIHRRTLERKIKDLLGRSPKEEIIRLRVNHATHLLKTTKSDIRTVSELSGYPTPEQMTTELKRHLGKTATQIRKE
jgi:LacI family transcriptional regulator